MASKTYCWAIIDAMREEMERDQNVILLGEDVAAAGGAFGATRGLFDKSDRPVCATRRSARRSSSGSASAPR